MGVMGRSQPNRPVARVNAAAPAAFDLSGSAASTSTTTAAVARTTSLTGSAASTSTTTGAITFPGATPMGRWTTAVNARATTPAKVIFMGDSLTEGQGASSKSNRWVDLVRGTLRSTYPVSGVTGGENFLAPAWGVYSPDSTWGGPTATSSSGTGTDQTYAPNLGSRMLELASGASRTYTVTGTSADIVWASNGGTFTWAVDGGGTTSVNTSGTYHVDHKTHITLGSAGSHTVTVTATTGPVYFEGLNVFNGDESAGIQVYEAGHTGFKTSDYLTDTTELARMMAFYAPDLVTIELGLNDAINAVSAATFQTNLSTLVGVFTALPTVPSILIIASYTPASGTIGGGRVWSDYVTAMSNVTAANSDTVSLLDLSSLMPQATTSGSGNYRTDGLHPNNTGHSTMAGLIMTAITVPVSYALTGSAASVSSTSGAVLRVGALTGAAASTSSTAGAVTATGVLTGAAQSTSSTSGAVTDTATLTGSAASTSSTTGDISISGGPQSYPLTGSAASTSTTTGAMLLTGVLTGSAVSVSTTAGAMTALEPLTGSAVSASTTTGAINLSSGPQSYPLTGSAASTSATTGAMTLIGVLAGSAVSLSTTTGAITSSGPQSYPLTGAAQSVSTTAGAVARTTALTGSVVSVSTTTGAITQAGLYPVVHRPHATIRRHRPDARIT